MFSFEITQYNIISFSSTRWWSFVFNLVHLISSLFFIGFLSSSTHTPSSYPPYFLYDSSSTQFADSAAQSAHSGHLLSQYFRLCGFRISWIAPSCIHSLIWWACWVHLSRTKVLLSPARVQQFWLTINDSRLRGLQSETKT